SVGMTSPSHLEARLQAVLQGRGQPRRAKRAALGATTLLMALAVPLGALQLTSRTQTKAPEATARAAHTTDPRAAGTEGAGGSDAPPAPVAGAVTPTAPPG